jgi:hypothetical protein
MPAAATPVAGAGRWAAALAAGLLLAACSGAHEPRHVAGGGSTHVQVAPTTDVPALVGLSIDGLRQRLGATQPLPPTLAEALPEARLALTDSVTTFRTGGLTLVASYNARSREVRDLLLLGHHEDSLMGRAHLQANTPSYLVMPVFYNGNAYRLLGLRVIPAK